MKIAHSTDISHTVAKQETKEDKRLKVTKQRGQNSDYNSSYASLILGEREKDKENNTNAIVFVRFHQIH